MGVYLHAKFEVYSIVLTSLIQEEGGVWPPSPSPLPPQNEALKSPPRLGLKKTTNWSKYQSHTKIYAQNQYLNQLVDWGFEEVSRLFVLTFEDENGRTSHSKYYIPKVRIKDHNVKTDGKRFFDQPINNNTKAYETIRKIATDQGDDYTTRLFARLTLLQRKL